MNRRSLAQSLALALLGVLALAAASAASVVPQPEPLHASVVAPAGFVATPAPRALALVEAELPSATLADISSFRSDSGGEWKLWIDRRSGAVSLAEGAGLPWITGAATAASLEAKARAFMAEYPNLFQVPASQLVLDAKNTRSFGERGQFWNVAFRQEIAGVPVEAAWVIFRVSHGNLVQFGVVRAIPASAGVGSLVPAISAVDARNVLGNFLGGLLSGDKFLVNGVLSWVQRGTADEVGYTGPIGAGWQPALVYRFLFQRAGSNGTWLALVDALNGGVVRFIDANDYAAVLKGSVLTGTNCTDPSNCVPGTAEELPVTLPNAKIEFVGGTCSGSGCYTNSAGAFNYPAGAVSATATLQGRYFNLADACGPIAATGLLAGNIDLGRSDPAALLATDCWPAHRESAPGEGPTTGGTGDTRSARTMFYHLNLINEKSRFYLPGNAWLKGVDGGEPLPTVVTNAPPACNAFWAGGANALVFMKQTPGLNCNNTGEVPAVGLHEFGHALDSYDGTGTAPESATGEAMGDTFALLQGQQACFGAGFRLPAVDDPNWGNTAGYGSATTGSASRLCTGVRELDYTRFCSRGDAAIADCIAPRDPDAPNGSRSGVNPPANPADAGTPARWNHMIATAPAGAADGLSNFYNCGGPETTGCAGPLNHGCHCESSIPSQANWDLAKQLISAEFGGDVYRVPQGPAEVSGWQYMDRLWYLTRDLAVSGYSATGPFPEGMTNGCTVTDWYSTYRLIDDDNGNLADGTPHADILFSAFDLHGIACGAAPDADQPGLRLPGADRRPGRQHLRRQRAGAAHLDPHRRGRPNTASCAIRSAAASASPPSPRSAAPARYFEDGEVAPGVTYYYSIQPIGQNASCYGQVSNCVTVTPASCGGVSIAPPASVTLAVPAANSVQVSWSASAGAGSYKILRKDGDCSSNAPEQAVGTSTTTSFLDKDRLVGGSTYSYRVVSSAASCASCGSAPSACKSIQATGSCGSTPSFAGVKKVVSATDGACRLDVSWAAGTPACGGASLKYDIYRSTDPNFAPDASNRVASGVTGTAWSDKGVDSGTRYYYVVRAVDSNGNADTNTVRRWEIPAGKLTPGTFKDDGGDTQPVKLRRSPTPSNSWAIRDSGPNNATRHYATTATGNYPTNACQGLETDTIFLGANPALSFRSRYDLEPGWDGGYVEVATADSGFSNWTKLGSVNYPGLMASPAGDPACGGPGFADGQQVFTGPSLLDQWSNHSASLSAYAGQAIRLRFLFGSDGATEQGGWFIDDIAVSDARLPSGCLTCKKLENTDPAIEYYGGFFQRADANASGGSYHHRTGVKSNGPAPYARLFFKGVSVTFNYATSNKGGTADVYIDGTLRESVSMLGTTPKPVFGHSRTYSNLGPGFHEIRIVHHSGITYVDGFGLDCDTGEADASAVEYRSETTTSQGDLALGPVLVRTVTVGSNDRLVSVLVEGSAPLTVKLLNPLGQVVASGQALLGGFPDSGLDADVSVPGVYTVQILRPTGVTSGKVDIAIAKTVEVR